MKINEILDESELNEKPVGMIGQMARKVGAKAMAKVGMKNAAAGMAGKVVSGDKANKLYTAWRAYAGSAGIDHKNPKAGFFADFLEKNKLPTGEVDKLGDDTVMQPQQIDTMLKTLAQQTGMGKRGMKTSGAAASNPASANIGHPSQQPAPAPQGQPANNQQQGQKIPKKLLKQLKGLSPAQIQQLKGLI